MPSRHRVVLAIIAAAIAMPATADAKTCTKKTTGTCTAENGQAVRIADRDKTLKLKSVAVKIVAPHAVTKTLGPFSPELFPDEIATASGRFVTFVVKVTNRGNVPVDTILDIDFDLELGSALYDESFNAENLIGAPSLINMGENNKIQPGLSSTGYITFDVVKKRTFLVRTRGLLRVQDESDKRIGVIRTYG